MPSMIVIESGAEGSPTCPATQHGLFYAFIAIIMTSTQLLINFKWDAISVFCQKSKTGERHLGMQPQPFVGEPQSSEIDVTSLTPPSESFSMPVLNATLLLTDPSEEGIYKMENLQKETLDNLRNHCKECVDFSLGAPTKLMCIAFLGLARRHFRTQ